jgi:hypothetical protein
VLLQRLGVAAFVILTAPFETVVAKMLEFQETDRPLPYIVLDHPMQNLRADGVEARAQQLAAAAQRLLAGEEPNG